MTCGLLAEGHGFQTCIVEATCGNICVHKNVGCCAKALGHMTMRPMGKAKSGGQTARAPPPPPRGLTQRLEGNSDRTWSIHDNSPSSVALK